MGGIEAVKQQHALGKLTVRERIAALADPASFQEIGGFAGRATYDGDELLSFEPSPTVVGLCSLNGRKVAIGAGDPTSTGEVAGTNTVYKMGHAQRLALQWRIPYIRILDSPKGSVLEFERTGRTYLAYEDTTDEALRLLGEVPVVTAVMGPVSGLSAVEACLCHFSVMVEGTGRVCLGQTEDVQAVTGHEINHEELGSAKVHAKNGVIHNVVENEEGALDDIRQFLSYMPNNVWEMPPRAEPTDDPNRRDEALMSIIPEARNRLYDPFRILKHVLDHDSVFEITPHFGTSSVTALARVNGYPVGVMLKNPMSSTVGGMDVAAGEKVIRFIQLCNTFHLPIVYFVDEPGFMVGLEPQEEGIVRAGAQVTLTAMQTKVPWVSFIVRQLYGVAGCLAFPRGVMSKNYGWATANWGGMHVEGGTSAAYRRVIESAPDPEAKRKEIEENLRVLSSTFRTAEAFEVEDIIDPRDTRPLLCDFVEAAQKVLKTQLGPGTGPGYMP